MNIVRAVLAALAPSLALGACRGGQAGPAPARLTQAPAAALSGTAGDTAAVGLKLVSLSYSPDVITYELSRPSYVTILSVTQSAVEAIAPRVNAGSLIEMAGAHIASLTLFSDDAKLAEIRSVNGRIAPLLDGDARLADVQEYNRCIAQAESMTRQEEQASRRIIGRDSSGAPIYGPPAISGSERNYERKCAQRRTGPQPANPTSQHTAPRQAGRFLMVFASDTPVSHEQVLALAISESDPYLMVRAIGTRLFGRRDAIWSGAYRAW